MKVLSYDLENDDGEYVGGFEAYVVNKEENNWKNFLMVEISNKSIYELIVGEIERSEVQIISVLKSIGVSEEHRGCGYGNELMDKYLELSADNSTDFFLLVADNIERQKAGFNLCSWYEDYGFENVYNTGDVTLMAWDSRENLNLKEKVAEYKNSTTQNRRRNI